MLFLLKKYWHYLVIFFLFSVSILYYSRAQPQIKDNSGYGPDGINYYHIYKYYKGDADHGKIYWPFNKRTGLPWLASKLPLSDRAAFLTLNLASGLLVILFCYLALKKNVHGVALCACIVPTFFYLHSPLRYSFFYPYTVDPPAIACYAIAAFLIVKSKYWSAISVLVLSCAFREQGVYFALIIGPTLWVIKSANLRTALLMGCFALTGFGVNFLVQFPQPLYTAELTGSQLDVLVQFAKARLLSIEGFLSALTGISHTLASFLFTLPAILAWRKTPPTPAVAISAVSLLLSIGMALLGGLDFVRIFYMGFPLYVIFLCNLMHKYDSRRIIFFTLAGLVANTFLSPISRTTVSPHEWWIPQFFDSLAGRSVPLTISFGTFWAFIYAIDYFLLARKAGGRPTNESGL